MLSYVSMPNMVSKTIYRLECLGFERKELSCLAKCVRWSKRGL